MATEPSLSDRVRALEGERDRLAFLVGEMLATFELPTNEPFVSRLGPNFKRMLAGWRRRADGCEVAVGRPI